MKIAVVGAGIAGTAAAWKLAEAGHTVTLFEQAPKCRPVGAGFLLQPSGQDVLRDWGVLDPIARQSARIGGLRAIHRSGRTLVELDYHKINPDFCAYGVQRSIIFESLCRRSKQAGVEIREGRRVTSYTNHERSVALFDHDSARIGEFDLLVAADGSSSALRAHSNIPTRVTEYPDAALWTIGPWTGDATCLRQILSRDGRMVGILPIGQGKCSFFWGVRRSDEAAVRAAGVAEWKQQVAAYYPDAEEIVAPLTTMEEVIFTPYRSVRMRRVQDGHVVWIGDAAHATSPHLGQGVNLALQDAVTLVTCLQADEPVSTRLARYESARRYTTRFYSALTKGLTPFFQTANPVLQLGRDIVLPVLPQIPYIDRQMVLTMAGLKTGWWSDSID